MATKPEVLEHWSKAQIAFLADPDLRSVKSGHLTFHKQVGKQDGLPAHRIYCEGMMVELAVDGRVEFSLEKTSQMRWPN